MMNTAFNVIMAMNRKLTRVIKTKNGNKENINGRAVLINTQTEYKLRENEQKFH